MSTKSYGMFGGTSMLTDDCNQFTSTDIKGLCSTAESISLDLLRAVENTVTGLSRIQDSLSWMLKNAYTYAEAVSNCSLESAIDVEDTIIQQLKDAEAGIISAISTLNNKLDSAFSDPQLFGSHQDSVVSEFESTIGLFKELHAALGALRWAILEHNADFDPPSKEASVVSADDAIRYLHS